MIHKGIYHLTKNSDGIIDYMYANYIDFEYSVDMILKVEFITHTINTSVIYLFDNQNQGTLVDIHGTVSIILLIPS